MGACATTPAASPSRPSAERRCAPSSSGCSSKGRRRPTSKTCSPARSRSRASTTSSSSAATTAASGAWPSRPISPPATAAWREIFDPRTAATATRSPTAPSCGPRFTIVARRALRPALDHHGRLHHVPRVRARVRRRGRPPLSCPAQRLPGLRAQADAGGPGGRSAGAGGRRCSWRAPSSPSRGWAAITSPATPPSRRRWRGCARESAARPSRSR